MPFKLVLVSMGTLSMLLGSVVVIAFTAVAAVALSGGAGDAGLLLVAMIALMGLTAFLGVFGWAVGPSGRITRIDFPP